MTRNWGIALAGLLIGCAVGVGARGLVEFPARAATGPTYDYKVIAPNDLVESVKAKNPAFAKASSREALEEGLRGFGQAGWRYVDCHTAGAGGCYLMVLEHASSGSSPAAGQ